jgi:hypothetical protein
LTSCFPGMLFTYFLNDFEIAPVVPIITGITFVFTFYIRCLLLLLLLRGKQNIYCYEDSQAVPFRPSSKGTL